MSLTAFIRDPAFICTVVKKLPAFNRDPAFNGDPAIIGSFMVENEMREGRGERGGIKVREGKSGKGKGGIILRHFSYIGMNFLQDVLIN